MLKSNFILALRILRRDKFFSLIIIAGLAIGYAFFHLLWLYSTTELRSDQYHPGAERICRIYFNWRYSDDGANFQSEDWGPHLFTCAPWFKSHYPEVEATLRIVNQSSFRNSLVGHASNIYFTYEEANSQRTSFKEDRVAYADENLFSFFSIPLIAGDRNTILKEGNSIAISESIAQKYFKDHDPLGKLLLLNGNQAMKVTGVFEDLPSKTHLNFNMVISTARFATTFNSHNFSGMAHTYIKLQENSDYKSFVQKVTKDNLEFWAPLKIVKEIATSKVQPLGDMVFTSSIVRDDFRVKSKNILHILQVVAICILMMGWINYINLTFSRVMKRMKELATRKTFGANYRNFLSQFLIETLLLNFIALGFACAIAIIFFGGIEVYTKVPIPQVDSVGKLLLFYMLLILPGCFFIALYPAVLANSFGIRALYSGSSQSSGKGLNFINGVVVLQYGVSIILIIWIFVMNKQMDHLLTADTGLNKDNVVVIDGPMSRSNHYVTEVGSFGNEILKIRGVQNFTTSTTLPGDQIHRMILFSRPGKDYNAGLLGTGVDENFIPFYDIQLLSGRNFNKDMPSERRSVLISEHGLSRLGFQNADDAVGQILNVGDWDASTADSVSKEIIGVFRDYRLDAFIKTGLIEADNEGSQGLFMLYKDFAYPDLVPNRFSIRVDGEGLDRVLKQVEGRYASFFPDSFFHWYFLDTHTNQAYEFHLSFRNQILMFTSLAIFIACLGLLGSTSFLAIEKIKELGIRKVLGAEWSQLGLVLIKSTFKQIFISMVIGIPLGYYFVKAYLDQYTLRIPLEWWFFIMPLVILLFVLFFTISPILYRAIRRNPIESLKYS